jgi:sugar phosphate isomerase/epimerase
MKRTFIFIAGVLTATALWTGCSQTDDSLGKSIGRWENFSVSSMIENREDGLEYIEVTMNNVIGKDTAGVRDRAAFLKAQIDSAGLKVWSVHMPYSRKIDISLADSAKRADVVNYMADMMKVAGVFQPQRIVLHPSSEPIAPDERAERLSCSRESIGLLAPVAQESEQSSA